MSAGAGRTAAVLGTGLMGAPLAERLLSHGFRVRVWNRTSEKAQALAGAGATVASTPEEAVSGAEAVVTMLADGAAVEEVVTGGAVLPTMRGQGSVWIQSSTVGPSAATQLAELAATADVAFVDAPVIGAPADARRGELVVLAAGAPAEVDRVQPLLDAFGSRTIRLPEAGAASALKLVVNNWLLTVIESLAETLAYAEALSLDPDVFVKAMLQSSHGKFVREVGEAMLGREHPLSFSLRLAAKDMRLVLEAAGGLELPIAAATHRRFQAATDSGHGEDDLLAAYLVASEARAPA